MKTPIITPGLLVLGLTLSAQAGDNHLHTSGGRGKSGRSGKADTKMQSHDESEHTCKECDKAEKDCKCHDADKKSSDEPKKK